MSVVSSALEEFISLQILDSKLKITAEMLIEDDLGISGDDAYDFIVAFSKRFDVDISGFDYSKYFHSEVSFFITTKNRLTIGMLNQAIFSKKLV